MIFWVKSIKKFARNKKKSQKYFFQFWRKNSNIFVKIFFRLLDDTYTIEEIEDILRDIREIVQLEAESELINAAHTNVLLLHQIFGQAQKWHLELEANLADLENRDLLDQVKRWEDSECISGGIEDSKPMVQKKLAPLNEGGPMQLLKIQIEQANEENQMLRNRLKEVEQKAIGNV